MFAGPLVVSIVLTGSRYRYAITDTQQDWSLAEAQVSHAGKSTVVSVKSTAAAGQKRKAEAPPTGEGKEKKTRRGGNSKKAKH